VIRERIAESANNLFKPTTSKRKAFFLISDIILIVLSMYAALWLRFDGKIPSNYMQNLRAYALMALAIKISFLAYYGLYSVSWRFFSLRELIKLVRALTLATLTIGLILFFLKPYAPFGGFPRSVLLSDYLIGMGLIGLLRISKRAIQENGIKSDGQSKGRIRTLIVGAGSAGENIIREMLNNKNSKYFPVGCIDDDPAKKGISIHTVKVLGRRDDIPAIIKSNKIDEVLISIPSAHSKEIKKITEIVRDANFVKPIRILPSVLDLIGGKVTLSDIHEIKLEDLLGRTPVKIDLDTIKRFVFGKRILITGAAGSIGFELTQSVLLFQPKDIVALDNDETEIYSLIQRLKRTPTDIIPIVGDIKDEKKIATIFEKYAPQIVMHCAAYKHVSVLEFFPEEAVKTNILGTRILAEFSLKHGAEKFVFISTDKAINPSSVMGASKRVGEELLKVLNSNQKTSFISVRFGNVLGSRGSVIPIFKEQIRKGGPVTVTHPQMKRYFMSPSEAVLLVLEAAAIGQGGEVFVLDMGEPMKIVDLAKEMIKLSGYEPDKDIPIVFSRIRAGEKLFEELLGAEEGAEPTRYEKIFHVRDSGTRNGAEILKKIDKLIEISYQDADRAEFIRLLKDIVPTYQPSNLKSSGRLF
jgi:FlaA1/EpsC-like NDP-sugar epimerase